MQLQQYHDAVISQNNMMFVQLAQSQYTFNNSYITHLVNTFAIKKNIYENELAELCMIREQYSVQEAQMHS